MASTSPRQNGGAGALDEFPLESERVPKKTERFLRRADQPAVAAVLCVCALLIGWFVVRQGLTRQGVIDIDDRTLSDGELQVELNLAPWTEFASLPGIGEYLGRSIVDYRQRHGDFQAIDDVKRVPGIGESRFRQIQSYLVITAPAGE
jgi:competence ComEA-like helix-hairpin-helix protein